MKEKQQRGRCIIATASFLSAFAFCLSALVGDNFHGLNHHVLQRRGSIRICLYLGKSHHVFHALKNLGEYRMACARGGVIAVQMGIAPVILLISMVFTPMES